MRFLVFNGIGCLLMSVGLILARRFKFSEWLLVCLAVIFLVNGLSHTLTTALTAGYNPGLISGALIFIPLGALTLVRLKSNMGGRRYYGAVAVGIAIHTVVSLLARSGG